MSRVLLWSPNYAPEVPGIAPLVTDAAEWMARSGHEVEVVTAMPNYPERRIEPGYGGAVWLSERVGGVSVHRSWLLVRPRESFLDKVVYEASFAAFSFPQVLRRIASRDVLVCVVPSLAAAVCAAAAVRPLRLAAGRPRFVLWIQDLVLEAAAALDGLGQRARRVLDAAGSVEGAAVRAADCVVVCSPGFRDYLVERGVEPGRIVTVLNGVDAEAIVPTRPPAGERTRFLYAGNLGYTQGFETLVEAARLVGPAVEVEIAGDGNAADHVRRLARDAGNVRLGPLASWDDFPELLAGAHVLVVIQRHVSAGVNLPSKIAPYLASGRPVLASLDLDIPAADLLRASEGALLAPAEDAPALAAAMRRLHEEPDLRRQLARAGRDFAVRRLGRPATLGRLEHAILG